MKKFLTAIALLAIVGYGLFEARRILEGPKISIETPTAGSELGEALVHVSGEAENISFLTINDKPAHTDEEGRFDELLSPPSGLTVVTVAGTDRFGRKVSKSVSITMLNYCTNG